MRVIVKTSPVRAVARTISLFALVDSTFGGVTVALKGTAGKSAPSPVVTVNEVPVVGGDGATVTALIAKFLWASKAIHHVADGHCRVCFIMRVSSSIRGAARSRMLPLT